MTSLKIWAIIAMIMKLGDMITTAYFVSKWGVSHEANPIVKFMIERIGLVPALVCNMGIFSITLTLAYFRTPSTMRERSNEAASHRWEAALATPHIVKVIAILMTLIVIWNLIFISLKLFQ